MNSNTIDPQQVASLPLKERSRTATTEGDRNYLVQRGENKATIPKQRKAHLISFLTFDF